MPELTERRLFAWRTFDCDDADAPFCRQTVDHRCRDEFDIVRIPHPARLRRADDFFAGRADRDSEVDELTTALEASEAAREDAFLVIAELRIDAALVPALQARVRVLTGEKAALLDRIYDLEHPKPAPTPTGTLFGAAVGSNGSPAVLEASAGRPFGIRRTFWEASQVSSGVSTAAADIAAGRVPWISFKLPASWAAMASGSQDAWLRDLGTRLRALPGEVWVALHHEPENDGNIADWCAMQRHAAPMIRADNVKYSIIVTGWHQFFSTAATYKMAACWPGDDVGIDLIGIDPYNEYGVIKKDKAGNPLPINLKASELTNQKTY